jgi:hypothetical protein
VAAEQGRGEFCDDLVTFAAQTRCIRFRKAHRHDLARDRPRDCTASFEHDRRAAARPSLIVVIIVVVGMSGADGADAAGSGELQNADRSKQ